MSQDIYKAARIPIVQRPVGYYFRWYYNGWHYWQFFEGALDLQTTGEKYRTYGTKSITVSSGALTQEQVDAVRTVLNTKEVYLFTVYGWMSIRILPETVIVKNNYFNGFEVILTAIIGSRMISSSGYSPVHSIPITPPADLCETIIGTQVWMCKNWDSEYPASKVYNNSEANRINFGGLYTWYQIMTAGFVPASWMVPTQAQWDTLIAFVGGMSIAGGKLKAIGTDYWNSPNTAADDFFGFDARGGGEFNSVTSLYDWLYEHGVFWTSVEVDSTHALAVVMDYNTDNAMVVSMPKQNALSLRLIKTTAAPTDVPVATEGVVVGNDWFTANWETAFGADGYRLSVSTDPAFGSFVSGFDSLDVGNVLTYDVTGLDDGTAYYYRLVSYNSGATSASSNVIEVDTPAAITLEARGDGSAVGILRVGASVSVNLTLTGTARFYTNSAGTTGESTHITTGGGPIYLKCPSGTSKIYFSDLTKIIAFGGMATISSGTPAYSMVDVGQINNVPRLTFDNFNFPNCIDAALFYSQFTTFNATLASLPRVMTKFMTSAGGTITGTLSDLPSTMEKFSVSASNTISGNTGDIPAGVTDFQCYGANTIAGDVNGLPAGLLNMSIAGGNTISGNVSGLPAGLITIYLAGSTTVSGDIAGLPSTITNLQIAGSNTTSGDIADLEDTMVNFVITGLNTISGDLVNIPTGCKTFRVLGFNTITGGFTTLNAAMTYLNIVGSCTVDGDLADLPSTMGMLIIGGTGIVTGDLSDLPAVMYYFDVNASNTITGTIADLPNGMQYFTIGGENTISGDLGQLPAYCYNCMITGNNTINNYTGKGWSLTGYQLVHLPFGTGLSAAEVDQLFIDLDGCTFTNPSYRNLNITGGNAAPTGTSAAARTSLAAKGVTITHN